MKKKQPEPAPVAKKDPDQKAKQNLPPQPAPGPRAGADEKKSAPSTVPPATAQQGSDLSEVPAQAVDKKPDKRPSDDPAGTVNPWKLSGGPKNNQVTVPADPIDWLAMRRPFLGRGLPWTGRDRDEVQLNWTMTYNNMMRFGFGPDLSIKIANLGTPIAYDFAMARDNPTQLEQFDMESEKMLPAGKRLNKIIVPILTPETLSWSIEKLTGKRFDFHF